ncbi:unnamed protein product [Coregonus sp. 'balchen']|nr:unnamed protein product [Coregonus sp. 'balchen']
MVMKKMMYYNMRVQTARRNLAETQANLLENKRNLLQLPEDRIRAFNYALKNLESEVQALCRKSARTWEDGPSSLSEGSGDRNNEVIDSWYLQDLTQATNRNELMIHFLLMFTSFRFCVWDYKAYGITGIKINRIIHIHNRGFASRTSFIPCWPARSQQCSHSQIFVSKVYLGRSFPIREGDSVDPLNYPKTHSVYHKMSPEQGHKTNGERPCSSKIHSGCDCSLFDNELVLPEYLIEFEYNTQVGKSADIHHPSVLSTMMFPPIRTEPNLSSQGPAAEAHKSPTYIMFPVFLQHNLEFADASYNHLLSLEGLRRLGRLKQLDLRWNQLNRARKETSVLRKHAPALLRLD